jgi:hypothetical protein
MAPKTFIALLVVVFAAGCASSPPETAAPTKQAGAFFSFHESEESVSAEGPEPSKYQSSPPGRQIAAYQVTNETTYTDLNGDSILDIMVQYARSDTKKFILLNNQWIQVKLYGMKRHDEHPELVNGFSGEKYQFEDSTWKLIPNK